jgi:hypothetical protein
MEARDKNNSTECIAIVYFTGSVRYVFEMQRRRLIRRRHSIKRDRRASFAIYPKAGAYCDYGPAADGP